MPMKMARNLKLLKKLWKILNSLSPSFLALSKLNTCIMTNDWNTSVYKVHFSVGESSSINPVRALFASYRSSAFSLLWFSSAQNFVTKNGISELPTARPKMVAPSNRMTIKTIIW